MSVRKRTWKTRHGEIKEAFIVDTFDKNGVRHIKTFATKNEADDHAAQTRINVKRGTHVAPSKSITVADACDKWIKRVEADGKERSTIDQYRQHAKLHIIPKLGKVRLANLEMKVEDFREDLLANLSRPMARNKHLSGTAAARNRPDRHLPAQLTVRPWPARAGSARTPRSFFYPEPPEHPSHWLPDPESADRSDRSGTVQPDVQTPRLPQVEPLLGPLDEPHTFQQPPRHVLQAAE